MNTPPRLDGSTKLFLVYYLIVFRFLVHTTEWLFGVDVDSVVTIGTMSKAMAFTALECLAILFVITPAILFMWNAIGRPVFRGNGLSYWQCLGLVIAVQLMCIGLG